MWTRAELKTRAKLILSKNYWKAFLIALITSILAGGGGGFSGLMTPIYSINNRNYSYNNSYSPFDFGFNLNAGQIILFSIIIIFVVIFALAIGTALAIFLFGPIEVSSAKYFITQRDEPGKIEHIFYSFNGGKYLNIVKTVAWRYLFIMLWSLFFTIPGIVKSYAYSMVPYIMAENPNMNYKHALKLSMAMTAGQKGAIFVLDLSFIGWYLLGALACGVGTFFVTPYHLTTKAELYVTLKERAIAIGICPRESFMDFNTQQTPSI